jgi:hypothetical protein
MRGAFLFPALLAILLVAAPLPARPQSPEALPFTAADAENVRRIFENHLSEADVQRLVDYFRAGLAGKPTLFPSDLRKRMQRAIMDLRLEYGFQFAVLLAQIKSQVHQEFNAELDELMNQLQQSLTR